MSFRIFSFNSTLASIQVKIYPLTVRRPYKNRHETDTTALTELCNVPNAVFVERNCGSRTEV